MKFTFYNDTGRTVDIHPATFKFINNENDKPIKPLETRIFILPEGFNPWVKMWDYSEKYGLQILIINSEDMS